MHVPYAHHEFYVDTNGYYYSPTYFPLNTQNVNKAGLVRPKLAKILSVSGAPPYGPTNDVFRDDGVLIIFSERKSDFKQISN